MNFRSALLTCKLNFVINWRSQKCSYTCRRCGLPELTECGPCRHSLSLQTFRQGFSKAAIRTTNMENIGNVPKERPKGPLSMELGHNDIYQSKDFHGFMNSLQIQNAFRLNLKSILNRYTRTRAQENFTVFCFVAKA